MIGNGFDLNPYNPRVSNVMIGGKQIKIFWNVDALKVSNLDHKEVTKFIELIEGIHG